MQSDAYITCYITFVSPLSDKGNNVNAGSSQLTARRIQTSPLNAHKPNVRKSYEWLASSQEDTKCNFWFKARCIFLPVDEANPLCCNLMHLSVHWAENQPPDIHQTPGKIANTSIPGLNFTEISNCNVITELHWETSLSVEDLVIVLTDERAIIHKAARDLCYLNVNVQYLVLKYLNNWDALTNWWLKQ